MKKMKNEVFLITLCGLLSFIDSSNTIAVCIGGQIARWQPQHLFDGLFSPPTQQAFQFFLFFNMQIHSDSDPIVFNTDINNTFEPSFMSKFTQEESFQYIQNLTKPNHTTIASMHYTPPLSSVELTQLVDGMPLDRITQYVQVQHTILNMYHHQVECVKQILQYENHHSIKFDYIISTREDIYFFRPMNLPSLISKLRVNDEDLDPNKCDIPYKRCLNFWGFNMRFFLLTRDNGIRYFGNRLSYYKLLHTINRTIENPERFELTEANALQLVGCPISVEDFPVTAVRPISHEKMCFIWFEVDRCVPLAYQEFVKENMCIVHRRQVLLQKILKLNPLFLQQHPNITIGVGNISLTEQKKRYENSMIARPKRVYASLQNVSAQMLALPKSLMRFTQDPLLVEYYWTNRAYK